MPLVRRALAWAALGALVSGIVLVACYQPRTTVSFEMDRPLPRSVSGIYDGEYSEGQTFAWTAGRATVRLPGLDRTGEWACVARLRGPRSPGQPFPRVAGSVDGLVAGDIAATNEYQDFQIIVPARPSSGATVVLTVEPTFTPGNGDPRTLGVQIDRFACTPKKSWVTPPWRAIRAAAGATAILTLAVVLAGALWFDAALVVVLTALAMAWLLVSGAALFGSFSSTILYWSIAAAVGVVLVAKGLEMAARRPLSADARRAVWLLGLGVFLWMLGLAHPGKGLVDALFQAHRLEWVLEGRYFFTQPMPSGVEFPYAIGLYVFAAPWTILTADFVTLLRAVVVLMEALAGGLLYAALVRNNASPRQALLAVVLYQVVPLPFAVVGNGNLTNAFGQSAALVTLTLVALAPPRVSRALALAGITVAATLALSSHVSTALMLGATLAFVIGVFAAFGGASLRPAAAGVAIALVLAASTSFLLYYRHFDEVFATAWNRVGETSAAGETPDEARAVSEPLPTREEAPVSFASRVHVTGREAARSFGWPLVLLAGAGLFTLRRADASTPLGALILAWGGVWIGVTATMAFARVGAEFERYAVEFLGRVNLAIYPALAILGARGASGRLASGGAMRIVAGVLLAFAVIGGARAWLGWFS